MVLEKENLLHLFVSPDKVQNYCFFKESLAGKEKTKLVAVPGSKSNEILELPADLTRLSTAELINFVFTVHYTGWSFGGSICAEDLLMSYTGNMRAVFDKWNLLEPMDDNNQKADCHCIAEVIRDLIFGGLPGLPVGLAKLLDLLCNFNKDLVEAVIQHPFLKSELEVLAQFGEIYNDLLQIEKSDPVTYNNIVAKLPFCDLNQNHWKIKALGNTFLEKLMNYRCKKKAPKISNTNFQYSMNNIQPSPPQPSLPPPSSKYE